MLRRRQVEGSIEARDAFSICEKLLDENIKQTFDKAGSTRFQILLHAL